VITAATGAVSAPITVGRIPIRAAITPDGKHAYVTNSLDGTVSVITTATGAVSAPITVGKDPWGVEMTPDGTHVYVSNRVDGTVSVITTATGAVSDTITQYNGLARTTLSCNPVCQPTITLGDDAVFSNGAYTSSTLLQSAARPQ